MGSISVKKYCIVEKGLNEQHAGSKARNDVADTLIKEGWNPLRVSPPVVKENVSYAERIRMGLILMKDWRKVTKTVKEQDQILIQYPLEMYPKVAMLALRYIKQLKRKKVKIIILIHDIESLRTQDKKQKEWYQHAEKSFLCLADDVIAHNKKMIGYLKKIGLDTRIHALEIFDYLVEAESIQKAETKENQNAVIIAGNLSEEKAGYVYQLDQVNTDFRLSGPNLNTEAIGTGNITYKGSFPPDDLPRVLHGKFGLVWDGKSIDECGGEFGQYMQYNNPHKTSLYLASKIPVIVWEKAAIAEFIRENQLGIQVGSLREIPEKLAALTGETYDEMLQNVSAMGEKLRKGEMLRKVLREIENLG